jgi:hypothetical protein
MNRPLAGASAGEIFFGAARAERPSHYGLWNGVGFDPFKEADRLESRRLHPSPELAYFEQTDEGDTFTRS